MTNLCGYDRDVLTRALEITIERDVNPDSPLRCVPFLLYEACGAVYEPAKLAEMLAARGRELGVERWEFTEWAGRVQCCFRRKLGAKVRESDTRELEVVQARAILLQWCQLPNGAREEAGRVLRGDT